MPKFVTQLTTLLFLASALVFSSYIQAKDLIKMQRPLLSYDKRAKHKDEVVHTALALSIQKFGEFEFTEVDVDMSTGRALKELEAGKYINVFIASASPTWERNANAIKVPIRQGLLSYRLLLIRKEDEARFSTIESYPQLAELYAGLQPHWSTAEIFQHQNLNAVHGHEFESLFLMLKKRRFDYIPRAVYEVYNELDNRPDIQSEIIVAPNLAIYIPSATYIYVSPNEPKIYQRLEYGMNKLVESGQLKAIFDKYYADEFNKAQLHKRRIIKIENPHFKDDEVMQNRLLWSELNYFSN